MLTRISTWLQKNSLLIMIVNQAHHDSIITMNNLVTEDLAETGYSR